MSLLKFALVNLPSLEDGRVAEAFDQAVRRCVKDCDDRPAVPDARKVTLEMEITPIPDEEGRLDEVKAVFRIKDTAPVRRSKMYSFGMKRDGSLIFSTESPTNVKQTTFDDLGQDGRVERPMEE